jgi:N-acetylmuramoyl-L-alanine amidase
MTPDTHDNLPGDDEKRREPSELDDSPFFADPADEVADPALADEAVAQTPVTSEDPASAEDSSSVDESDAAGAQDSSFFSDSPGDELYSGDSDWLERGGPKVLALDRPRVARPSFIPRWVPISIGVAVLVVALVAGAFALFNQQAGIRVPDVKGIDVGVATTRLAQQGLELAVIEHRFGPQAKDTVLSQDPAPGAALKRGAVVNVVVSAGTEEFVMPDVVGNGIQLAKGTLETKGLDVSIEAQPSDQASGTVLATNPGPGQKVRTGQVVTVVVAAAGPTTQVLLPYEMRGLVFVLDPAPVAEGQTDVPLDVARRVRSLIEASNGKVVTTRALADTGTAESAPVRAQRATVGSSTAAIGFSVVPAGQGGVIIMTPAASLAQAMASGGLASVISSELAGQSISSKRSGTTTDAVLVNAGSPWGRVQLGSFGNKQDAAAMSDPAWEDRVARGIYRALGSLYGRPGVPKP